MTWRLFLFITLLILELPAAHAITPEKTTRFLEIRMVYDQPTPDATELEMTRKTQAGETITQKLIVGNRALLDVSAVKSAAVTKNHLSKDPEITLHFTEFGTKLFSKITRENIGRQLAIVIDGKLIMAPRINGEIPSGSAVIHGNFTEAEAKDIATKINQTAKSNK